MKKMKIKIEIQGEIPDKDKKGKPIPRIEKVDTADDIKTAPFLTGLAPSSIVEMVKMNTYK